MVGKAAAVWHSGCPGPLAPRRGLVGIALVGDMFSRLESIVLTVAVLASCTGETMEPADARLGILATSIVAPSHAMKYTHEPGYTGAGRWRPVTDGRPTKEGACKEADKVGLRPCIEPSSTETSRVRRSSYRCPLASAIPSHVSDSPENPINTTANRTYDGCHGETENDETCDRWDRLGHVDKHRPEGDNGER